MSSCAGPTGLRPLRRVNCCQSSTYLDLRTSAASCPMRVLAMLRPGPRSGSSLEPGVAAAYASQSDGHRAEPRIAFTLRRPVLSIVVLYASLRTEFGRFFAPLPSRANKALHLTIADGRPSGSLWRSQVNASTLARPTESLSGPRLFREIDPSAKGRPNDSSKNFDYCSRCREAPRRFHAEFVAFARRFRTGVRARLCLPDPGGKLAKACPSHPQFVTTRSSKRSSLLSITGSSGADVTRSRRF
jgi:hypothetical protein